MSAHARRAGLWAVNGPGVLAREQDLVLLSNLADSGLVDRLLDLLSESGDASGDGLQFTRAVQDILDADGGWRHWQEGHEGPALVAFGPAGTGLAVTVTGTASVEITTAAGNQRIVAGPSMLLHCLVGSPVQAVHGTLGLGQLAEARTDRFSRLDAGVVRAGGFSYHADQPASAGAAEPGVASPVVASQDEPPRAAAPPLRPVAPAEPAAGAAAAVEPAASEPLASELPPAETEPVADAGDKGVPAPDEPALPFESVLLLGKRASDEAEGRRPLPKGANRVAPVDPAAAPAEIIGVYCKNGHFDDPEARFCAVCGISMNQRTLVPRPGVRPPLGLLVTDGGAVFQLDADYVAGREPTLDPTVTAGKARPLRIADGTGTVSRVHAKVSLDGWRVLVTDLASANGTRVRQPGEPAGQQLASHVPVRLLPGSYVDLGGTGFHYESHRGR